MALCVVPTTPHISVLVCIFLTVMHANEFSATLTAQAEENKVAVARSGCLPALVSLVRSDDRERERYAARAISNLAEMLEVRYCLLILALYISYAPIPLHGPTSPPI